jgi:hypothetical protein
MYITGMGAVALPELEFLVLSDLSATVRNKPNWHEKFASVGEKWKQEFRDAFFSPGTQPVLPIDSYRREVYKVLKQVHPDMGIERSGLSAIDVIVADVESRLRAAAVRLAEEENAEELTELHIARAVREIVPGELATHGISEGNRALTRFEASLEAEEDGAMEDPPTFASDELATLHAEVQQAQQAQRQAESAAGAEPLDDLSRIIPPQESDMFDAEVTPDQFSSLLEFAFDELEVCVTGSFPVFLTPRFFSCCVRF